MSRITSRELEELLDSDCIYFDGAYTDTWEQKDGIVTFYFAECEIFLREDHMLFGSYDKSRRLLSNVECQSLCRRIDLVFL